jgi:hypothetical protein
VGRPSALTPVNADIEQLDVIRVPEQDPDVNRAGVKGIGELAALNRRPPSPVGA